MSTEVAKKSGSGYAWLVMVGFGMVMCATIGAITVMGGLFYYPVCEELGFDLSSFTLYVTLSMVFMGAGHAHLRQDHGTAKSSCRCS